MWAETALCAGPQGLLRVVGLLGLFQLFGLCPFGELLARRIRH
jgi:hypothetical protein